MFRFGKETRRIMGEILNATIATISGALLKPEPKEYSLTNKD